MRGQGAEKWKKMNIEELDLSNVADLKVLKDLRAKVDRAITSFEDRRRREAHEALKNKAQELGYNLQDLLNDRPRERVPAEQKYMNPDDHSATWSGRGRKPKWVESHLSSGKSLDDLKI